MEEKAHTCPSCGFHFTRRSRSRVQHTLDSGTWEELFSRLSAMVASSSWSDPAREDRAHGQARTGQNPALIAGRGEILGRKVVLAVLDFKFLGGSMGEVVGEKIALACDVARQENRPLVMFTASGGARMHEGMLSLMQMAKTCSALSRLQEDGGFSVCVLTHPTTGGVTAFAMVCDLTVAEPGALIGFAGPRVIASTIKQELPEGFQRAEFLLEKGQLDLLVDRHEMRDQRSPTSSTTAPMPGAEPPRPRAQLASGRRARRQRGRRIRGRGRPVSPCCLSRCITQESNRSWRGEPKAPSSHVADAVRPELSHTRPLEEALVDVHRLRNGSGELIGAAATGARSPAPRGPTRRFAGRAAFISRTGRRGLRVGGVDGNRLSRGGYLPRRECRRAPRCSQAIEPALDVR